jgi:Ras-related protein Rab-8A
MLTLRDVKTRLIDSQPDAAGPSTLGGSKSGVDVSKDQKNESSGGCC